MSPSKQWRILLTDPLDAEAEARLHAAADIVTPAARDESTLAAAIRDCHAVVARTHTPLTRHVLESARDLRVVGVAGVGLDRVDLGAASELGIAVVHTPAAASDAVAELAIGMMIQLLRPIPRLAADYRAGRFREARAEPHGGELRERTIGILGMGRIGSRVARIAAAGFGARVIYNDIARVGPFDFPVRSVDLPAFWSESDILSLHVPLTDRTRRMINASVLAALRPAALLINTSRGAVVDTDALVANLREERLAGAALDVTDPEPLLPGHPLLTMENCIVTPHIAARTFGGYRRMCDVVDDVLAQLAALSPR
jgi:phosphoglycerate dehydrogenase-like enzyme